MSSASPRKSTRAAATRRKAPIIDDDSEGDENQAPKQEADEQDDFSPAPAPQKRARGRPKKVAGAAATPKPAATRRTPRQPRATESVEPTELIEPTQVFNPPTESPANPTPAKSPRKRIMAASSRKSRVLVAEDTTVEDSNLPTPQPSEPSETPDQSLLQSEATVIKSEPLENPEPAAEAEPQPPPEQPTIVPDAPLADITETAANEHIPVPRSQADSDARPDATMAFITKHTVLEKPMDIVVRKRLAGIPSTHQSDIPQQRTVIEWLVLTNFKSYAGEQRVGPFHRSFSAVVGPNGSGKSNVIDSLLFVFGFRASKMRQGKISALIHNSAAFPDLEYCEVAVHFEEVKDLPEGGCELIPDSKLIISRRAFKNNTSKYYINNKESSFTIVTSLLKGRGVDLDHKRFLILQGEVESIAQMKPKAQGEHDDGLLEYLEDIIGTSQFKTPIEQAITETDELNETCQEKERRVKIVEKEKDGLEDRKNGALAYIKDENEIAVKQSALYQIYVSEFDDHIHATSESVVQMQTQLDDELQKHQGNEEGIKELEKQYKKGSKECERLEKQAQELQKEVAKIDKETVKFEEKKKFMTGKQKKLEKTKETSRHGISEATTNARQYASDLEGYAEDMVTLEEKMAAEEEELEAIRASLAGKTQDLSDDIAAKQKSLEPWTAKINEKQSAIALAQSELDIIREKENAGARGITEVEAKIAALQETKQNKLGELEECKAEHKKAEKEAQRVQSKLDQLTQQEPVLRSKLSGARQNANEARASLSETQNQGNVQDKLMKLKDQGRINGFHGRLGNLGTIDHKYDIAISTACGQLDHFVVDSAEVGEQCIDYLRKNNLGRGTFRPLNRQQQRDLSPIETPENVPRLFDLVKPKDDKFKIVFYNVLQDTLVAKDLDQANRVAYSARRWRVVTLNGELIETAGTMSGGGNRASKGKMSSKLAADVTSTQVAKLEQDRDALEQSYAELQEQQRDLEAQLRSLNAQIPQLETRAQKFALEYESFDRNIADSKRRIKELSAEQASVKSDKARISKLEKSIASAEKEVLKLHAETAEVEAEIKELQEKIMEIGGSKLRTQNAKVADVKGQIDSLADMTSNAEVSKSKEEKQLAKHEKAHADAVRDLEKLAQDAEKIEEDMEAHKQSAAGIRQQAEEAQEALEATKEELQALKTELDDKTASLNETRAVEIEMRNKLEDSQKTLNEFTRKQLACREKLSKLSYQSISDLGGDQEQEGAGLTEHTKDELRDMDKDEIKDEIAALEKKIENVTVDLTVLAEYRKRTEEHAERTRSLDEAVAARDSSKKKLDELKQLRLVGFMEGFAIITSKLKEMYNLITNGGNAELELVDSWDPFAEGINFSVMPPKKSWKSISNLSGGEKTLSSLALVFALHHYKPTPLYVMDEIDAALDFRNVSIIASYIQQRTKNAQFIVISLRNNMFELSARLVGVYKVNHMTKSVTIENKDYIKR
ncbi:Structural maintenance of chromosomes protein 4 [Didymosphaeria variabile]|uniref:Structural maintenance of chromosomes protein n=1 Tax=Didymosphaeria variabile TaxID=1932322 RepID=A0A9W8XE11_9PLEO|nr:Structural maintenance of chromosomes protein 4 [Didymosphaeria variabile]KAJ4348423.1 Structural maintenance of chromosomes protein 4 [Didymosphaeria variabile]